MVGDGWWSLVILVKFAVLCQRNPTSFVVAVVEYTLSWYWNFSQNEGPCMDVIKCDKCDIILPVSTAQIPIKSPLLLGKAVRVLDIPVFWTSDGTRRCLDRWTWANLRESFRWSGRAKMVDLAWFSSLFFPFDGTILFSFNHDVLVHSTWICIRMGDPTTTNLLIRYQRGYSGMYLHCTYKHTHFINNIRWICSRMENTQMTKW